VCVCNGFVYLALFHKKTHVMSWLPSFLRPKDPKELVQKWRKDIRKEKNEINRNIRTLHMEQKKVERSIKEAARRNDLVSAKVCIWYTATVAFLVLEYCIVPVHYHVIHTV